MQTVDSAREVRSGKHHQRTVNYGVAGKFPSDLSDRLQPGDVERTLTLNISKVASERMFGPKPAKIVDREGSSRSVAGRDRQCVHTVNGLRNP